MELKHFFKSLKDKLPVSKSSFLVLVGLVGLMIVLISSFDFTKTENNKTDKIDMTTSQVLSSTEYTNLMESKLEKIISEMLGHKSVRVMVTLESGTEYVYADEIKVDADVTKDQSALKTQQSDSNQKTYIVVKDSDGNEHPLIVTEKMPVVRGVVVVCNGGEISSVASAVRLAVRSALNVDDQKICVIGRY